MTRLPFAAAMLAVLLVPAVAAAHSPSVTEAITSSPAEAVVLEDATLSRAIGATIGRARRGGLVPHGPAGRRAARGGHDGARCQRRPGRHLHARRPRVAARSDAGPQAYAFAEAAGVDGAVVFEPAADPPLEVHGGLGFTNFGNLSLAAPASGSYWVAVYATDPEATGKYVFAPGVREEFGVDAIGGMADLIAFFMAPWPPDDDAGS